MASKGVEYPSVFVVDSRAGNPPLTPKPGRRLAQSRRNRITQTMLYVLVSMALIGIVVEACCIYYLYKTKQNSSESVMDENEVPQTGVRKGGKMIEVSTVPPKTRAPPFKKLNKPLAHLIAGSDQPGTDGIMPWNNHIDPDIHELKYEENKLVVEKEGYYYIYSKLCFDGDKDLFIHLVVKKMPRYPAPFPIELLRYRYRRNHSKPPKKEGFVYNSYLGGVFHLFKDDAVFVLVRNSTVHLQTSGDNFFGMFMV